MRIPAVRGTTDFDIRTHADDKNDENGEVSIIKGYRKERPKFCDQNFSLEELA